METIKANQNINSTNTYFSTFKNEISNVKKISVPIAFKLLVKNKKINFVKLFQEKLKINNSTLKTTRCITNFNTQNTENSSNNESKNLKNLLEEIKLPKKYRAKKRYKSISINTDINNFISKNTIKYNNTNTYTNTNNDYKLLGDKFLTDLILSPSQSMTNSLTRQLTTGFIINNNKNKKIKNKNKINNIIYNRNSINNKTNLSLTNKTKNSKNSNNSKNSKINRRNINLNFNVTTNTDRIHKPITKHTSNTSIPTPRRREFSKDYGSIMTKESSLATGPEGGTNKKTTNSSNNNNNNFRENISSKINNNRNIENNMNKKINYDNNQFENFENSELFKKMEDVKVRANNLFYKYSSLVDELRNKLVMYEKNKKQNSEKNRSKSGNKNIKNKDIKEKGKYFINNGYNDYFDYVSDFINNNTITNCIKKKLGKKHSFTTYHINTNNISSNNNLNAKNNNDKFFSRNLCFHVKHQSHG